MNWDNANWRKSSTSDSGGCVEVAYAGGLVGVRDDKDRDSPILEFTEHEWRAFVDGVKGHEFDYDHLAATS